MWTSLGAIIQPTMLLTFILISGLDLSKSDENTENDGSENFQILIP